MGRLRVLVCGGRYFVDVPFLWVRLDEIHRVNGIECIIEGASDDLTGPYVGADFWARKWAAANACQCITEHAEWKSKGRAAGPIRNERMADEHAPDVVVAFKGDRGTASMCRIAEQRGIRVERAG